MLFSLKFNSGLPLPIHFLHDLNNMTYVPSDQHHLSKYLLEIFLLDHKSSLQAAAACCLSMSILTEVSAGIRSQ
ncbi:hypothetical protein RI129_007562 [Pyrocoelia pectoralis]|uniref:Cyclin C-terminal domain-containing protein n=1 Tax=Pyrocoelia pectoralis TaxID=417401 RepID=A0AAN7ZIL5_9COLE